MRTTGTVSLGLRYFFYVYQHRHMLLAADPYGFFVGLAEMRIIPAPCTEDLVTFSVLLALESFQHLRYAFFSGLIFFRYRYAVPVVPYTYQHWHLQHPGCVDGLPEMAFA